ncbi:MAG TPA: peptidylprolyl isomerase [Spirochaetia bacterium]|nr:peptidylprolyl isomerase [Spirochaetia bacterium]
MRDRIRSLRAACLLLLPVLILAGCAKGPGKNSVALVNGEPILREELDRELNLTKQQLAGGGQAIDETKIPEIEKSILNRLIDIKLIHQESISRGIAVTDEEAKEQLKTLKGQFQSEEEFTNALKTMGLTEEIIINQMKRDLALERFLKTYMEDAVKIPDEEILDYYVKNPQLFIAPERVRASHILVTVDSSATDDDKTKALNKIRVARLRLEKGEDFAEVAKQVSEGPSAPKGGDLDFFARGQMVKPFEDAAFALKKGEISGIVETQFGYHLIKATDRQPETVLEYDQVKERIKSLLGQERSQTIIEALVAELKEKAKIKILLSGD